MRKNRLLAAVVFTCFVLFSCNDNKQATDNTFYVSYSCKNDSLLNTLKVATSGKQSYYDNEKKLQIVSVNYVTEDHPNSHYFKTIDELPANPAPNTIKYEISFNESMVNDSIAYSMKKFKYSGKEWQSISIMGTIKVFDIPSERDKNLRVIKKNVARNVLSTIVTDSYSR